ncbi:unnamed protein product [Mycena citricolor]|uniref:Uncharacterized protein n=1 Tax=Mycena citricolor TaxID=2018698 RepID=A0AAD2HTL4_9AGAR|nr:unnamed protein product [Mycena citricolor]
MYSMYLPSHVSKHTPGSLRGSVRELGSSAEVLSTARLRMLSQVKQGWAGLGARPASAGASRHFRRHDACRDS